MAFYLAEFLVSGGLQPSQITILTPFKAQCLELVARCSDLSGLTITTAAQAQSAEADVVILSLVTTRRSTEFLRSPSCVAAALSRARHGLYLLGNPAPLQGIPHWDHVLHVMSYPPPEIFDRLPEAHTQLKTMMSDRLPVVSQVCVAGVATSSGGGGGGVRNRRHLEWQNLAQQKCTKFCRGILGTDAIFLAVISSGSWDAPPPGNASTHP